MLNLKSPIFSNEIKAREHLERLRWPDGRYCPHCGATEGTSLVRGKKHRPGLYYCNECGKQFTVTVGTLFERSHVPLTKWLAAFHLMASSKKGMSAHQLHRMLGVTYKTAWFMAHRIREAMRDVGPEPMGGGGPIQADETYFGKVANPRTKTVSGRPFTKSGKTGPSNKRAILALVSGGKARTFHLDKVNARAVREILVTNAKREAELHTDESRLYSSVGLEFAKHRKVNHKAGEYVDADGATINACENYFSVFKRGMKGVYQHCAEKHLHRYLAEFDYRYNNREITDAERAQKALGQIKGRRLTYRRIAERRASV